MNTLQALCLGVLQGITEFLPISSSGHLALAQYLFGFREPQLFFDVAVHFGTLMAVLLVFRSDLLQILKDCYSFLSRSQTSSLHHTGSGSSTGVKTASMILVGSVPTALIGLLLRDVIERLFTSPAIVGLFLWTTGLFLICSRWPRFNRQHLETPNVLDALVIGLVQGAAISPGLSRSGVTITTGLLLGLSPELAFRFSFLLSIPAILGALALEVYHLGGSHLDWQALAVGCFSAFLVGWVALRLLQSVVVKGKLFYFAPYCFAAGIFAFVLAF
jgi:undecaprenyl-diphosphatase